MDEADLDLDPVADRDLLLLREYRAADAAPTPGLLERLQEDLLEVVLEEEAALRSGARTHRPSRAQRWFGTRWLADLARPAMLAGAAASVAVVVAVTSQGGDASTDVASGSGVTQAATNILDSTASSLFGGSGARTVQAPPIGTINGTEQTEAQILAGGPGDESALAASVSVTRSPAHLRAQLREAAGRSSNPAMRNDRGAFEIGMAWVVDPDVPPDLRAAVLRSFDGLDGLDQAVAGSDVLTRKGVVLSYYDGGSGIREQYVLAQTGATLLEHRAYMDAYVDPACPPGVYTAHEVFSADGTRQVSPGEAPWAAWHNVLRSCDPANA